jgi:hypothetical protein
VKDEREVEKVFDKATEERLEKQRKGEGTAYLDAVTAALGWVLEEYEDSPIE